MDDFDALDETYVADRADDIAFDEFKDECQWLGLDWRKTSSAAAHEAAKRRLEADLQRGLALVSKVLP